MRDDKTYVTDIHEAIVRIEKYASKGRETFEADELIQNWIVHHVQIIGEASGKVSESLKHKHQEVPWAVIKAMRNILVHSYFGIDLERVWNTVEKDLPVLRRQIEIILAGLP